MEAHYRRRLEKEATEKDTTTCVHGNDWELSHNTMVLQVMLNRSPLEVLFQGVVGSRGLKSRTHQTVAGSREVRDKVGDMRADWEKYSEELAFSP